MTIQNKLLVIGDAMLDTYIYGVTERVSPEAPVPVVRPTQKVSCLGGAANVARNAAALGADVTALFVVGDDDNGKTIIEKLGEASVDCSLVFPDQQYRTIHKMRVIGNNQQVVRIDWHDDYIITKDTQDKLLSCFYLEVQKKDIVIISDYGKGMCSKELCTEIISLCRKLKKPVIVDPKGRDWEKYRGASIITPNMKELNQFAGKHVSNNSEEIEREYCFINKELGIDYLLLTRSECGMSLLYDGEASHISARSSEVFDVSGAGDTVVAALAAFLRPDMKNITETVSIANIAAGIVVTKAGTAIVTVPELKEKLASPADKGRGTEVFAEKDYAAFFELVDTWRDKGDKIVVTNGCFDILHRGHISLLQKAKKQGDRLIVAVNSDASVKRLKGQGRPINCEEDRAYIISTLKDVDAVVIFDPQNLSYTLSDNEKRILSNEAIERSSEAPMALMKMIAPDVEVKGGDYGPMDVPEAIFAKKLVLAPLMHGRSTTGIIQKTKKSL